MTYIKQGSDLIAKMDFQFKSGGKGRAIKVRTGQRFWVTNNQTDQSRGHVMIDRAGKGCISHGYAFTSEMINKYFAVA